MQLNYFSDGKGKDKKVRVILRKAQEREREKELFEEPICQEAILLTTFTSLLFCPVSSVRHLPLPLL